MGVMSTEAKTNIQTFTDVYTKHLTAQVTKNPSDYGYSVYYVPTVVARMVPGLKNGGANKEGAAIRATCKELGIPYTYAGIKAYLA